MNTATFVRSIGGKPGDMRLYRCAPFFKDEEYDDNKKEYVDVLHEYVVVSAASVPFSGPETYIFPSNKDGKVTDWGELTGSYRGGLSHDEALERAGYKIA